MKILCIGDIVGRAGRSYLSAALPVLKCVYGFDFVLANAENAAGGSGLTPQIYTKLLRYGVDAVTLGDHCFKRREVFPILQSSEQLVRPANLPEKAVGRGHTVITTSTGVKVGIIVVLGRLYMKPIDCPFAAIDRALEQVRRQTNVILVEVHAEATSEKVAIGWYLDGKVSAVFGTHTHVPTADARVLPHGTGYITDLGMTGPYESVLGRNKNKVVRCLISGMPDTYDIAENDLRVGGLSITVDPATGKAQAVEQIILDEDALAAMDRETRSEQAADDDTVEQMHND